MPKGAIYPGSLMRQVIPFRMMTPEVYENSILAKDTRPK